MAKKGNRSHSRAPLYNKEIAERICVELAKGKTLIAICEENADFPADDTVRQWARTYDEFYHQYARARELGYERMADEIISISDDGRNDWMTIKDKRGNDLEVVNREAVERSRLRLDTRKWLLSKALPKIYGDKLDVNAKHDVSDSFLKLWQMIGKAEK